jgi:hypothetical protein
MTLHHPLPTSDPQQHPAARWLTEQLRAVGVAPWVHARLYGLTMLDPHGGDGAPVARSAFVGSQADDGDSPPLDQHLVIAFDAVAVVRWIDGAPAVTALFVNP